MNRNLITNAIWAFLLVILGVVALLYNFGAFASYATVLAYIGAGVLAVAGLGFLGLIAMREDRALFVIPGCSFLALAGVVYLSTSETIEAVWLGALFLAGIAAGFLVLFLSNRHERWWALLQAGTIGVIAVVGLGVGVPAASEPLLGAALFGGFALSFFLLYLFGGQFRRFVWSLIMAGVLAVFAMTIFTAGYKGNVILMLWPILAVLAGALMFARMFTGRTRPQAQGPVVSLPAESSDFIPSVQSEPARIVQPEQPAAAAAKAQVPKSAPPEESKPLPDNLAMVDPANPGSALDALLEASKKAGD